jgi:uncharacterized protein
VKVLVTGSHGLIGGELVADLRAGGHTVTPLVRRAANPGEASWDPGAGTIDAGALEGHDAAVHLAGVGIGDARWRPAHKQAILQSRVQGTSLLARTLASLSRPPGVLASGSAVGYYGDRGDEELTERSGPGTGFLAEVVQQWEAAAAPAADAGIRVAYLRSGVVMSAKGGGLKKQLLPFKMGIGGRLGSGRQYFSWIAMADHVAATRHVLATDELRGPVNVVAMPVTNAEFTRALGRVLRRPTVMPVPTPALNLLFGREMVAEMMLVSQRAVPAALGASGFRFRYPEIEPALRHELGR